MISYTFHITKDILQNSHDIHQPHDVSHIACTFQPGVLEAAEKAHERGGTKFFFENKDQAGRLLVS